MNTTAKSVRNYASMLNEANWSSTSDAATERIIFAIYRIFDPYTELSWILESSSPSQVSMNFKTIQDALEIKTWNLDMMS
jgi:hypothetical protein